MTLDILRGELFALIDATPNLDWLLLTKRPENVGKMWPTEDDGAGGKLANAIFGGKGKLIRRRDNLWLGTSISDQATYDVAAQHLWRCRDLSPVLFLSYEPALGPVKFWHEFDGDKVRNWSGCFDWAIVGGESGPNARPFDVSWARSAIEQCRAAGVPCFIKQLGARPLNFTLPARQSSNLKDKKGGDIEEWPADLRVREFPKVT